MINYFIINCVCLAIRVSSVVSSGMAGMQTIKLSDGNHMPAIALGTYLGYDQNGIVKPKNNDFRDVIARAIDLGYRHFDTAFIYGTEEELGKGIKMKIDEGVVKREDIFVTTKLWNTSHRRDEIEPALRESLRKLSLDYVDLYLMHWPIGLKPDYTYSDVDYLETWAAMEDVQRNSLTRSIGISNFNQNQIERLLSKCNIRPVALQIEVHTQLPQTDLVLYAQKHNITIMAYSPFGSLVQRPGFQDSVSSILDTVLSRIADKYKKTQQQIVLRWLVDRNIVPIPKTVTQKRLQENIDIFNFKLNSDDIEAINNIQGEITRYTLPSFWQNHPYYPFERVENPIADPFKTTV